MLTKCWGAGLALVVLLTIGCETAQPQYSAATGWMYPSAKPSSEAPKPKHSRSDSARFKPLGGTATSPAHAGPDRWEVVRQRARLDEDVVPRTGMVGTAVDTEVLATFAALQRWYQLKEAEDHIGMGRMMDAELLLSARYGLPRIRVLKVMDRGSYWDIEVRIESGAWVERFNERSGWMRMHRGAVDWHEE